jgi:hypothetical protein
MRGFNFFPDGFASRAAAILHCAELPVNHENGNGGLLVVAQRFKESSNLGFGFYGDGD